MVRAIMDHVAALAQALKVALPVLPRVCRRQNHAGGRICAASTRSGQCAKRPRPVRRATAAIAAKCDMRCRVSWCIGRAVLHLGPAASRIGGLAAAGERAAPQMNFERGALTPVPSIAAVQRCMSHPGSRSALTSSPHTQHQARQAALRRDRPPVRLAGDRPCFSRTCSDSWGVQLLGRSPQLVK